MSLRMGKQFGAVPLFDPKEGIVVRSPQQRGKGWWVGAPSSVFDPTTDTFYLVYRVRRPPELGRGVECRIAASSNGVTFEDIGTISKDSLDALSVERGSLIQAPDGRWLLYLSYASAVDGRWYVGRAEADAPEKFEADCVSVLFSPDDLACEGVKDPCAFLIGRMIYLLLSYAVTLPNLTEEQKAVRHATGDIYNTGLTESRSAAAISGDGRVFQWLGDVSPQHAPLLPLNSEKTQRWDGYCRRLGALLPLEDGGFLAFYDGSASVEGNYEEQTGLAITFDLQHYHSLSPHGPILRSPYGSGSLRYVDVLPVGNELFYYYEMACADGSHELRVSVVER
ncbi:hypothetical protein CWRG_01253 [Chthonomonas calidirosea]|uniref:hypothetical protein n=1 Tax=Chthonomonas calidirosea TaxID=454171 RepID=UPI0006DD5598|nr:hypothetical protein [Chthonomonas calidirosea]CEK15733.1 hypothetical protein CWRG_01253 [Chthonomonas calidirosea]